ncbi:hypothetical protein JIG36_48585 [Actinoplanes sp. LDG1-06]|uniref:Uncharacterized protein n=1 Tax=Paractinoplanes ovalisporus TaxID=2810368 RepID=A0ABS2AU73_9ACTN|nr:hypothetical protein [Actinoplanes ovalisporus]MBM2623379.1 hypothetical protein [Actinoplanes ovalisporus]
MDTFNFQLPDDPSPDMLATAQLGGAVSQLAAAVESLHQQHLQLRRIVEQAHSTGASRTGMRELPWPLRWRNLNRPAAAQTWAWLIDWVGWFVDRYHLTEEIPACWPQHPPLVDELTALAAAWHSCYDDNAHPDGPLLWHERLTRARDRLREWDDYNRCRNGTHSARPRDLTWADGWHASAIEAANNDLTGRTEPVASEQP